MVFSGWRTEGVGNEACDCVHKYSSMHGLKITTWPEPGSLEYHSVVTTLNCLCNGEGTGNYYKCIVNYKPHSNINPSPISSKIKLATLDSIFSTIQYDFVVQSLITLYE